MRTDASDLLQSPDDQWVAFPGGELEGRRPRGLCRACRDRVPRETLAATVEEGNVVRRRPLCFQCYRAELDRERVLHTAAQLDTASEARFQDALPFEPVGRARLAVLQAERTAARAAMQVGVGRFEDRRRRAQIAARRALQAVRADLQQVPMPPAVRERLMAAGVHAAELQLPESWLPFVIAR